MLLLSCFSTSIINHNTIFIKPFVVSIVGSRKVEIGSRKDKVESNSSGLLGTANSSSAARITFYLLLSTFYFLLPPLYLLPSQVVRWPARVLPPSVRAAKAVLPAMGPAEAFRTRAVMRAVMAAVIHGPTAPAVLHEEAEQRQAPAEAEERAMIIAAISPAGTQQTGNEPDDDDEFEHIAPPYRSWMFPSGPAPVRKKTRAVAIVTAQVLPFHLFRSAMRTVDGRKPAGRPAFGYSLAQPYISIVCGICQEIDALN